MLRDTVNHPSPKELKQGWIPICLQAVFAFFLNARPYESSWWYSFMLCNSSRISISVLNMCWAVVSFNCPLQKYFFKLQILLQRLHIEMQLINHGKSFSENPVRPNLNSEILIAITARSVTMAFTWAIHNDCSNIWLFGFNWF